MHILNSITVVTQVLRQRQAVDICDKVHSGVLFFLLADTIESDARLVFSDVVDEFCSIRGVASRFESWRNTDADAYREAYVNLCLPKVLGPLVRLRMLMWNPLQVSFTVFVNILMNHGHEVRWWLYTVEVWVNSEHKCQTASLDERTVDAQSL
jgi:hypothetical protein